MDVFALIYSPGPNWQRDRSIFEQDLAEHRRYMEKLGEDGKIMLGGPFSDSTGGMCVLQVQSAGEAQKILDEDPAILNGVYEGVVRPWRIVSE